MTVKWLYALGGFAYSAKTPLMGLLLLFYNQVVGLPAQWVSLALAVSIVIDAIWDPIFGQLSDDVRSRWGRRHPFMYASAAPFAICWILLFFPPTGWSHVGLFWWLLVLIVLSRVFISLFEVSATALNAELSREYHERTQLWSFRYMVGALAGVGINWMGFAIFLRATADHPVGQLNPAGYGPYAITTALISVAAILTASIGTHRLIPTLYQPPPRPKGRGFSFREMGIAVFNRDFGALILSGVCSGIVSGVTVGLGVYLNTYFWELPASKLATLGLAGLVGVPAAAFFGPWLSRRIGKKAATMALMAGTLIIGQAPLGAKLLGFMPPNGTDLLFLILLIDTALTTACTGAALFLTYSMMSDVVEYVELRTGRRSEGLMLSSVTTLQKALSGVATIIPGLILVVVGFPEKAVPGAVPQSVLNDLVFIYLPTIATMSILSIICVQFYRITQADHEAVNTQLRERAQSGAG
jgi:GPH family glycoside/pentoside/hexuronide:cation symporter